MYKTKIEIINMSEELKEDVNKCLKKMNNWMK